MGNLNYTPEQVADLTDRIFAYVQLDLKDHILTLTLDRPEKRNALNPVMMNELAFAMVHARFNPEVWMVVLKANGPVFCAGADLKAFMGAKEENDSNIPMASGDILLGELFPTLHKPVIAQVEGPVYAGGFLLLSGCTYVVAQNDLTFGLPEVKRGLFPYQVMAGLLEILPKRKVLDWCIRGFDIDADTALEWGLITHTATKGNTSGQVQELVNEVMANSPTAIRLGLEAYDHIRQGNPEANHKYLMQMLMKTIGTADAREGIKAFREKRKPQWTGA